MNLTKLVDYTEFIEDEVVEVGSINQRVVSALIEQAEQILRLALLVVQAKPLAAEAWQEGALNAMEQAFETCMETVEPAVSDLCEIVEE